MKTERTYDFSVIEDKDCEKFSLSKCTCDQCLYMHLAQKEWDNFKPKTNLQKRMKRAVKKIEENLGLN